MDDALAMRVALHMRADEGPTALFGLVLEEAREGYARVSTTITREMLNGVGTAHGGVLFTLADTAFAYACNSRNNASVAQHAAMTFLLPAALGDRVVAEAVELGVEGRSGVYSVSIRLADGRLAATFNGLSRTIGRSILPVVENG